MHSMNKENLKKIGLIAYIVFIATVCTVPFVGAIFKWGSQSTENRTMLSVPALFESTEDSVKLNMAYTTQLADYYSEHFGFRQELVTANAALNETLFARSTGDKTTIGKDGWYYFNETLDDYTGASALSERGVYRLQKTLDLMNRYAEAHNITMLFFSAPNKNSIYPEFMPWHIRKSTEPSNLDRLNAIVSDSDYYIDMKSRLLALKKNESRDIYLKNDSHWNNLGALAAYNAMQDNLNSRIDSFDYRPVSVSDADITETQVSGDLTDTLYPSVKRTGLQYDLGIEKRFSADRPLTDLMAEISTTCQERHYSEICYRDSFFNALIGINSNGFAKVKYTRVFPYDMTAAKNGDYDIAVVEIVERNLPQILNSAPAMEAVGIDVPPTVSYIDGGQNCECIDNGKSLKMNGQLGDWVTIGDESNIYIELRDSSGQSRYYEAFPICEGNARDDSGFSLTIGKDGLTDDAYEAYIHVGSETGTQYTQLIFHS